MARLIAQSPCAGLLPVTIGNVIVSEIDIMRMWSVAPFKGQEAAVSARMAASIGVGFPSVNRRSHKSGKTALWAGAGRALVVAETLPDLADIAAVTDQSDAFACVRIEGAGAEAVLARLVPVDLRAKVFKTGHTARTMVNHMTGSVTRVGPLAFEVMVMRSMARTLVQEVAEAAQGVAARG